MNKEAKPITIKGLNDFSIYEQIEMIEIYGCLSNPNNIKKSYENFIVGSYGIGVGRDLKGNFECNDFNLELLNQVANDLKKQIVNKPNNDNLPVILEVINEILEANFTDNYLMNCRAIKFTAKEYALTYIFDLYSKGENIPINRTNDAGLNAKYLKGIGEVRTGKNHKGDSFYRAVKEIMKYDLNDVKQLNLISSDWKNAVLTISKNDNEIKKYLSNKNLI